MDGRGDEREADKGHVLGGLTHMLLVQSLEMKTSGGMMEASAMG